MNRKFVTWSAVGFLVLSAGPALPEQGGNTAAIQDLDERIAVLEGQNLDARLTALEENFGPLDQTVAGILLTLSGVQDQLDDLDGRLSTVEEGVLSLVFAIVVRSAWFPADPLGVFIYQDCDDGEMALGGRLSSPEEGETWVVNKQGFNWAGDGVWATGWAGSVTGPSDEYVENSAVCATPGAMPAFGQNPLQN